MLRRWVSLALTAGIAALTPSCSEPTLTEVLIVVDTDLDVPDELTRVTFRVQGPGDQQQAAVADWAAGDPRPAILAMVHRGGELGPFTVSVTGERSAAGVVRRRRARFSFIEGRTLALRMDLLRSCGGVTCETEETCAEGGCRPIDIEPSELVEWTGEPPPAGDGGAPFDGSVPRDAGADAAMDQPDARVECMGGDTCDDGVECTVDRCEAGVCFNELDHAACPDDGVACTVDRCDPMRGCVSEPDPAACDDANPCTTDVCDPITGCSSTVDPAACDDGVSCTVDTCDPALGCSSSVDHASCPSGELCDDAFTLGCTPGPTFTEVFTMLDAECRPCHTQGSISGGLSFATRADAYAQLVSVPAECGTGNVRVIPRDFRTSLLWRKLTRVDLCGAGMPRERTMLDPASIDLVERWIAAGALDN